MCIPFMFVQAPCAMPLCVDLRPLFVDFEFLITDPPSSNAGGQAITIIDSQCAPA